MPLAFWLVVEHRLAGAFYLFVAAGLSDAVDGWLARRYGGNSVGALLDPVADKALLVTMYVTLAAVNGLPDWLAILVVFRDLVIVGGVMVLSLLGQQVVIRPLYVSKLNTVLQIVLVAATLFLAGFDLSAPVHDGCADLGGRGHDAGVRRGLCLDHGATAMNDSAELPPPETEVPAERRRLVDGTGASTGPGDAWPAGGAGRRPAGRGLAGAAAVRLRAGAVRRGGGHRLRARSAHHAADPAGDGARTGGAADDPRAARRSAAVRAAAVSADPAADRPAAGTHPAIRAVAAALGQRR